MDIFEIIKTRRSTRTFKNVKIESEKLNTIIEAGRYAPSGSNSQSTHFIVIQSEKVLTELAALVMQEFAKMETYEGMYRSLVSSIKLSKMGKYCFYHHAPVLILLANKKDYGNNIADCACAIENMMLMTNALDLASCYVNQLKWLNQNEVIVNYLQTLGLKPDEVVCGGLSIGYANTESGLPLRTPLERKGNLVTIID